MTEAPFTETADAEVEAGIAGLVRLIAETASGLRGVQAVLLGGSLGRGEATVRPTPAGLRLDSDVEVYLVGSSPALHRAATTLGTDLRALTGFDVSVAWLHPTRLRRARAKNLSMRSSRTIQLYELRVGSRLLAGSWPVMADLDPSKLPLAEGVRLILNRFAEASVAVAGESVQATRWVDKVAMAAGDTLLLAAGSYTASYRERAKRLSSADVGWDLPPGWRKALLAAYDRKLQAVGGSTTAAETASIAATVLRHAVEATIGLRVSDWGDFADLFVPHAARHEPYLRYLPAFGPAAIYEACIVLIRARRAGRALSQAAVLQAARGRPLSLWLQAAAAPLFLGVAEGRPELLRAAGLALQRAGVPSRCVDSCRSALDLVRLHNRYWQVST